MKKPILKGPRITLRPVKISDARNFVRWFRDDDVCRYVNPGVYHSLVPESNATLLARSAISGRLDSYE